MNNTKINTKLVPVPPQVLVTGVVPQGQPHD